jgi:hypothetical protein
VRAASVSLLREIAKRVDVAKVLAPLDIDDHSRSEWRRIGIIPEKEFLTVALEGDFDEVRQALLRPRAQTQKFLAPTAHQFLRPHFAQFLEVLAEDGLE